jgi:4-cresol dehydrogenase (hydroxylating)
MQRVLPPSLSSGAFDRALKAFAGVVGEKWVLASDQDRETYIDPYALGDGYEHAPGAAVAPQSTEEVQAIVRLAGEHRIPLWPVSKGKNLGYGGPSPVVPGSVVLDLSRMNRVLDVDVKHGTCLIEPGVGFIDFAEYLVEHKIPLWLSTPANGWGSVIGNALDRGIGYTPYGDHTTKLCGLEVVLPNGGLLRTGMGALANGKTWQHYQFGFGPSWDQMFVQSNFGVVTKAGLWLMPEPEATARVAVHLPKWDDISWAVDELAQLRLRDIIRHNIVFGNYLHDASVFSKRSEWYGGPGAIPEEISQRIIDKYRTGWWTFALSMFGYGDEIAVHQRLVREALEPHLGKPLEFQTWHRGDPYATSARPAPNALPLQIVNWRGGRGGHIGFSPVMPPDGQLALAQSRKRKARFDEYGHDYYTSFTMGQRHICNVNMIIYDCDDKAMTDSARALFRAMIADAAADGFGEYRTHIGFMQDVASCYDFNDHALMRLNESVKDALDPAGVIAPGKNGIWPKRYRLPHP